MEAQSGNLKKSSKMICRKITVDFDDILKSS